MTQAAQPITTEQLARLYQAANEANSLLSKALNEKPRNRDLVEQLRQRSRELNSAYDASRRQFKRQQKAENRASMLTKMIRYYMDHQEAAEAQP